MTLMEAVDARRSRRKYLTTPIDPAAVEKLQTLISQYNQDAGPTMHFVLDDGSAFSGFRKSYGMFTGVRNYIGLIDNPKDANQKEKLGYYGELIVLAATMLGLGTCWVGGSFDRKSCPFRLGEGESIACVIALGNPAPQLGFREKFISGITHRKVKKAGDMFTALGEVPDWFMAGMRSVEKAPSAVMRQPVKFTYDNSVVTASVPDISDTGMALDLGIAKAHFEIGAGDGKWEWGNGARFIKRETQPETEEQPQEQPPVNKELQTAKVFVTDEPARDPVCEEQPVTVTAATTDEPVLMGPPLSDDLIFEEQSNTTALIEESVLEEQPDEPDGEDNQ